MNKKHVSYLFIALSTVVLFCLIISHGRIARSPFATRIKQQLVHKEANDTITALLFYHAADYFVYQGSVIGFQYDLLKQMSHDLKRPIRIDIESDPDKAFAESFTNKYDIVGMDYNKKIFPPQYITQSEPHSYTYPVLLMRKGTKWKEQEQHVIHVPAKYTTELDLKILDNPEKWKLVYEKDVTVEDLIGQLEDSTIDYMVCNYNVAITLLPFYTDLVAGPRLGNNFARTWILNSNKSKLNASINQWLKEFETTQRYLALCKRYLSRHSPVIKQSFGTHHRNHISSYDKYLKQISRQYGVDWRFVSSIIFQESRFSSDVLGMGGSYGIMQMMPCTYRQYGMSSNAEVDEQIRVGVKHIASLYSNFSKTADSTDIYYFVAAAYNAGITHITDAQALCKKYGDNPRNWEQVSGYLRLKSFKKYYSDPVVHSGYYPGKHTVQYVNEVMSRYQGYLITKK